MDLTKAYQAIQALYVESLLVFAALTVLCILLDIHMIRVWRVGKKLLDLAGVLIFLVVTVAVAGHLANDLRDIPNIQSGNYVIAQGIVFGHDTTDLEEKKMRGIALACYDTGEVADLHVHYGPIRKGMELEVIYLPFSRMGAVLRELPEVSSDN